MKNNGLHIGFQLTAWTLVLCITLPIAAKFTHLLSDHEHEVCSIENQSHFHEIDLDCEFYNFKINHHTIFEFLNYELYSSLETNSNEILYYSFLKNNDLITSRLRGPPFLT